MTTKSSILRVAKTWSEVSDLIAEYNRMIGDKGITNFFGYASLIKNHNDIKPASSRKPLEEGGVANQQGLLKGSVMTFNVLAAGDYALRGTWGTYTNAEGKVKEFRNIGCYAGIEEMAEGLTPGINITVNVQDRHEAWSGFIPRELGTPPAGITIDGIISGADREKLAAHKGTEDDKLSMYKLQIVSVATDAGIVPAIVVAINEDSPFQFVAKNPYQIAHLILDGHGYRRPNGRGGFMGGTALDYFEMVRKDVLGLGLKHERLEEIARAVHTLAGYYADLDKLPINDNWVAAQAELLDRTPELRTIVSPYVDKKEPRDPVSEEIKALPENTIAHTTEDKARRIVELYNSGRTATLCNG